MKKIRRLLPDPLLARLQLLHELHHVVRTALPPALREHVSLADVADGRVTLQVRTHGWAQQLRFHQRELLKRLNDHPGLRVERLRIQVQGGAARPAPLPPAPARRRPARRAEWHQRMRALLARLEE